MTQVYQAACDGSSNLTDLLKRLKHEQRNTALETKIKDGSHFVTPLIIAAHNGHLNSVKILLSYGADIEARGTLKIADEVTEGCTTLWAAASAGRLDVVKLLIERNADVEGRTSTGSTPLRAATYRGHLDIVRCLVESGADVNARSKSDNSTILMVACFWGHLSVVTYLINKGAFMDLQGKDDRTALHDAVERGHLKIVSELLARGASQLPNDLGLTPLLYACDECLVEMVEHIIGRPECTKEQRIDALELLGATIANDSFGDSEKAFSYMKRGMEERYEDPEHPLLKKEMEPVEAYQNRKESQTPEELALLEGDDHVIGMEGLIIRERILGSDNLATLRKIHYRECVLADSEEYELCCGLWQRALEKKMKSDVAITLEDLDVLTDFTAFFGIMVQKGIHLSPNLIEHVFEALVAASENSREEHENEEQEKMLYCALYLLMIYIKVKGQNAKITDFLQRFLRLNPRTNDGNTLLHLVAWHETQIFSYYDEDLEDMMQSVCKLPCVETMKLILHAGCDVNAINTEGNTPLLLAVTFKPADPIEVVILSEMLLLLLEMGADPQLPNMNGQTPLQSCETDEARRILSEKRGLSAMNVDVGDAGKIGSGTDKRREEGGFLTKTKQHLNENTQKETETKEISGLVLLTSVESSCSNCLREKSQLFRSHCRQLSFSTSQRGDCLFLFCGTINLKRPPFILLKGQLRELTQQLESVQEHVRQKDGQLRKVTQQLANVQGQLQERDGELRQMTQQLTNVQGQLQERDGDLRQMTQQLTNIQGQLQERDGELRQMTQQFTNVQGQLQERDGELRQMTQQLTNVQGQLQVRDGELRQMTQQLTNVQGQLQERDGQLRQMTQQFTNVQGQLGELTQQLTNAQIQLQEKDEENTTMEEQLREKEQEVNELEMSLSTAQQALSERPRQQSPDWVISRDQIQLTEQCIGKGGWGSVVEAKYCGCTVAVKQIYEVLLNLSSHNREIEMFEREMSIASKCRHPCLLQFIGATNDEGSPLFVTELMETSLRKLLEHRSLSIAEVIVISLDVARALNYLHQKKPRPILHRDISSVNVLLWRQADQWRGKVSDYGAANFMQHTLSVCPGAAVYSAPEALTKNRL
ncbi:unnamed protein product [Porites evermanni]|uniref:Protein fem-1 homolog B n=1 Tax=Porites evermanni TaxID=104178 RepID=A0ABN8SMM2_9CNID|nr:unnamed protein product [Porites evermanni]